MSYPKIMVVSPTAGLFGGTERVLEVLLYQTAHSNDISYAFLEDGPLVNIAHSLNVPFRLIERSRTRNLKKTFAVVSELRKFIQSERPAVVFAWTDFAQLYASPASIAIAKSLWWQRSNIDGGAITRLCKCLPHSHAIANSKFTRDQMRQHRIKVADSPLYPPYDANKFTQENASKQNLRNEFGIPNSSFVIGSVGRMQHWKGFDTLVDSIRQVRKKHEDVFCVIVGGRHELEPHYENLLQERIAQLGISEHVMLPGSQRNIADWMRTMDVFVHSADREPFGIVVPEAMAIGLPVIASIPGGPAEAIEPEVSGLLVSSNRVDDLTRAILRLKEDPALAYRLSKQARRRAIRFSSENFSDNLIATIAEGLQS
ncbi:glycosyltransferase [Rhodopirellula sallentina]|uniref:Glycosyl transferase, group 1 n=1 Tax=Rhodopirellula sallentina SM41 TaxID=1263870 RepID=M5U5C9_9BACT|nr:glycosyltransferase [Rhodopirellula sallentina]EMI56479.1 glycosyl transferase, group 1 [Rhodopirellula sallentina SM41]